MGGSGGLGFARKAAVIACWGAVAAYDWLLDWICRPAIKTRWGAPK
jgi:hypothetical protein